MKIKSEVYIDGKLYRHCVLLPIKFENVLDATLDTATIEIQMLPQELMQPLTPVKIIIEQDGEKIEQEWIVAADESREAPVNAGTYHHTLTLIEPTKFGEGFLCDSTCITHPGGNIYTDNAIPVVPDET